MEKGSVLTALLVQDRLIRYNLQMLEMLLREIKGDMEELNLIAEACFSTEEIENYTNLLQKVENVLFTSLKETIEYLYDLYEVFNFEITLLANLPEELLREVERLGIPNSINSKMENLLNIIKEILEFENYSHKFYAILTPFRAYKEIIRQALEFNTKLFESNLQKT